jgi:hypothetical protein
MSAFSRSSTSERCTPSARAEKFSAMRCRSTGSVSADHVLDGRREPPVQHGARAGRQHQRLRRAGAGAVGQVAAHLLELGGLGPGAADQAQDRLHDVSPTGQAADQVLGGDQLRPGHRLDRLRFRAPVVASSMARSAARSG